MSIVEVIRQICESAKVDIGKDINFMFGDTAYINNILKIYSSYSRTSNIKFPLLALHAPFDEVRGSEKGIFTSSSVAITIAINTLSRYTNEERAEKSFKEELRPIYDSFIKQLKMNKHIELPYNSEISHIYRERYDLGSRGAMDSNGKKLDDLIDAIEIENLEIKVKQLKCCNYVSRC
jgi:hypothetical protein